MGFPAAVLLPLLLPAAPQEAADPPAVHWVPGHELTVEGQAWPEAERGHRWDRLPARAEADLRPPLWRLSQDSAGIALRFVSDADTIHARWSLRRANLAMNHMPASGVSGLDLYARDATGRWRWVAAGIPGAQQNEKVLVTGMDPGEREYLLFLPLYNGVEAVEVGVPAGRKLEPGHPLRPAHARPVVFYGTSITQGACASRPGMVHTAILRRAFDRPVVNLGFSGQGKMDLAMASLLGEIDAAVYVVDCLPNMNGALVAERALPFAQELRRLRPDTPIVFVEDRSFTNSWIRPERRRHHANSRGALMAAVEEMFDAGLRGIHYVPGEDLLGDDADGGVDGSHPNDLGFLRQADALAVALAPLLQAEEQRHGAK